MDRPLSSEVPHLRQREIWFLLAPLAVVPLLEMLAKTLFSAILARFPTATDELAGYGLGYAIYFVLYSPCMHVDQMMLSLGANRRAFKRVLLTAFALAGALGLVGAVIGLVEPVKRLALDELQRSPDAATTSRAAFVVVAMSPVLVIAVLARTFRGALIYARKAHWVTAVCAVSGSVSMVTALALVQTPLIQRHPLLLPLIAAYIEALVRLGLYLPVALRVVWPRLPSAGAAPSAGELVRFQYPLIVTALMMSMSRPIINAFIGPLPDGKESLAALAVVNPLASLFVIWLGDVRVLPVAFRDERNHLQAIRRFVAHISGAAFALAALLSFTPLSAAILRGPMGVQESLIPLCRSALVYTCFWPLAIATRGFLQGVAIARRQTHAMTWSGPWRVACNIIAMAALVRIGGMSGATMGTLTMLLGFSAEAVVIAYFLRRIETSHRAERQRSAAGSAPAEGERPGAELADGPPAEL